MMDRLLVGIVIAISALVLNGSLMRDVMAQEATVGLPPAAAVASQMPAVTGPRRETVLSLVIALEALRAAPSVTAPHKV
jgi:hypothetical protein